MTPTAFIEAARTYKGTRWHHLGRSKEGLDCIGLLLCAADDCGIPHPIPAPYPKGQTGFDLTDACARIGRQVQVREARDGDILVFACGIFPGHLGLRTTVNNIPHVLHAPVNRRKVVEEPLLHELVTLLRRVYRPTAFEEVV